MKFRIENRKKWLGSRVSTTAEGRHEDGCAYVYLLEISRLAGCEHENHWIYSFTLTWRIGPQSRRDTNHSILLCPVEIAGKSFDLNTLRDILSEIQEPSPRGK